MLLVACITRGARVRVEQLPDGGRKGGHIAPLLLRLVMCIATSSGAIPSSDSHCCGSASAVTRSEERNSGTPCCCANRVAPSPTSRQCGVRCITILATLTGLATGPMAATAPLLRLGEGKGRGRPLRRWEAVR